MRPHRADIDSRDEKIWTVLRTKTRQEKALARDLDDAGIDYVLPLVPVMRVYGHRTRRVEKPLFSGYLFLHGTSDECLVARETRRVLQVLRIVDQAGLEREVTSVCRAIEAGGVLTNCPYLRVGRRVRVTAGPFRGIEGLINDIRDGNRITLVIHSVGQAVSLEIDASLLEPVEDDELVRGKVDNGRP